MDKGRIIVVGGSAGSIEALRSIVRALPFGFPTPICVVVHLSPDSPGLMPSILRENSLLDAVQANDGDLTEGGRVYVAPPDRHLLLTEGGRLQLGTGPKENFFRPAVDPLFRSAALLYGPRAIGVLLSGGLDDGSAGLRAIKNAGGVCIVQDPADAQAPSMPRSALGKVAVDHCLPAASIGALLVEVLRQPVAAREQMMDARMQIENKIAAGREVSQTELREIGELSSLTCPDCAGVLLELKSAPLRYRCHTGHAYSSDTLADALRKRADDSMWAALRRQRERQEFLLHVLEEHGQESVSYATELRSEIERIEATSKKLRGMLDAIPASQPSEDVLS